MNEGFALKATTALLALRTFLGRREGGRKEVSFVLIHNLGAKGKGRKWKRRNVVCAESS